MKVNTPLLLLTSTADDELLINAALLLPSFTLKHSRSRPRIARNEEEKEEGKKKAKERNGGGN